MSSISEAVSTVRSNFADLGVIPDWLSTEDDTILIDGRPALKVPKESLAWSWRTTVNRSLLPASVSPENRRHLLYAILQDLIRQELPLHQNTSSVSALAEMDPLLAPFDDVYRMPPERSSDRLVLFPIHISVPSVFDTYERKPNQKSQTDKGFRGKFVEFFCSDETGFFDDHLLRVLRNLFAQTEGLTPLDRALVKALESRILEQREPQLRIVLGDRFDAAKEGQCEWWSDVYLPLPERSPFRPLEDFAMQGRRLHADIDAIAHTPGLSRIERVAYVERILAYHFALYMVRLTEVVNRELHWAYTRVWPDRQNSPWSNRFLAVQFNERKVQIPSIYHADYVDLAGQLNESYLLLPVLNNIELAIRAVARTDGPPAQMRDGCWVEAKHDLANFDEAQLDRVRALLSFLAQMGRHHTNLNREHIPTERLIEEPVELLFDAIRMHYTAPKERRYPKNHHQTVFESTAGSGSRSFLQRQPARHIVLGDELVYLMVLTLFEHRDPEERGDSTCAPRDERRLRRPRLALREFEKRLESDLLVPANDAAHRDLRATLSRLGLVDRLSDVGDGNFLRHPTGI